MGKVNAVTAVSNVFLQLYNHWVGRSFSAATPETILQGKTKTYTHLDRAFILAKTRTTARRSAGTGSVELGTEDMQDFRRLSAQVNQPSLIAAVKELRKRKKNSAGSDEDEEADVED